LPVAPSPTLRAELDEVDSATAVGHSYGGTVTAEAGRHSAVAHLLSVSSSLPGLGQPQWATMSGESDPVSIVTTGAAR
jgi:pimeloyl-ACP methyl ester carboxylesterase